MADWQWQEALQSLFIGVVFAYMCGRLFTLISSIRDQKFRLERGGRGQGAAAPLLASYDEQEYAPADELNVPYSSIEEEELDADDGGDEHEGHGYDSSSSSSESDSGDDRSREVHAAGAAAVTKIVSGEDEAKPKDVIEDVTPDSKSDDKAVVSGRDSLKVLVSMLPVFRLPFYLISNVFSFWTRLRKFSSVSCAAFLRGFSRDSAFLSSQLSEVPRGASSIDLFRLL